MLCRFVIAFLSMNKCLLMSWLQSPSTVILEPKKVKSVTASTFSSSVCHEVMGPTNLENSAVATGLEKVSFHSNPKDNAKKCSNYHTVVLISHASKVMLKILQARLQQHVNHELLDVQAGFRKGRGTRDQIANIH